MEKKLKMPVSYLCDRNATTIPSSQVGFINGIVKPYFEKLAEIFPGFMPLVENIRKSDAEWKKRQAQEKK